MSRPLAALTGATGFLGAHLVRALHEAGFAVRALARREPSPPGWGEAAPEVVSGDLSNSPTLERLVDGAEVVVHCAGAIRASDPAGFMAVNRDGTARLVEAVRVRTPDARLVLVSSLAARSPELSAYAASKRAAESAAAEAWPAGRLIIVRPPAIYGPGDRETLTLFRAAAASPVLPLLSDAARTSLIHVEDASAHIAALAARPGGGTWALADANHEGYAWREILAGLSSAVGRRPLLAPLPGGALRALAHGGEVLSRLTGRPALLAADKVAELLHPHWGVSRAELAEGLPAPRYGLNDGFASAAAWYRAAGWLR
jgi:nucleoside-diphosphate-sugar epimerase